MGQVAQEGRHVTSVLHAQPTGGDASLGQHEQLVEVRVGEVHHSVVRPGVVQVVAPRAEEGGLPHNTEYRGVVVMVMVMMMVMMMMTTIIIMMIIILLI